jgi:hypothetical protein
MTRGEKVPETQSADPFPALKEDMVFEIPLPQSDSVTADIVSPDFSGTRQAKVESLGGHRYRVTVNKADLVAYDMIRLHG